MDYTPDEFLVLLEEVERQGGVHLPDPCTPQSFRLKQPDAKGEMKWKEVFLTGCGKDMRFAVTYEPAAARNAKERQAMQERGAGFATVCARDDDMGKWPRFAKLGIFKPEPETEQE